jgi:hypothetical protein
MKLVKLISLAIFLIGLIDFGAFCIHSTLLGGSASDDNLDGNHYFVSEHGRRTEVSKSAYDRIKLHERTVWISFPIALVAGLIFGALQSEDSKKVSA